MAQAKVAEVTGPPANPAQFAAKVGNVEEWKIALVGACDGGPCTMSITGAGHARVAGSIQLKSDSGTYRGEQKAVVATECGTGGAVMFNGNWTTRYSLKFDLAAGKASGSVEIAPDREADVVSGKTCNWYRTLYQLP